MQTFRGKPLKDLTAADLNDVPNSLLIGMLKFHYRLSGVKDLLAQRELIIAEVRRRKLEHWMLTYLDPPRCACGGPGLYRVGKLTYCRRCRPNAVMHRQQVGSQLNKRLQAKDSQWAEIESRMKKRDSLRTLRQGKKQKP